MERRTIIKSVAAISTLALTGCLGDDTPDESEISSSSDEWVEFDVDIDLEQDVEYWFPETESPRIRYETNQPAEIVQIQPYRKGDDLEIRGVIKVNEEGILNVSIKSERDGDELNGGPFGSGGDGLSIPDVGEHQFTLSSSSTRLDKHDEIKITVTGPTPENTHGYTWAE